MRSKITLKIFAAFPMRSAVSTDSLLFSRRAAVSTMQNGTPSAAARPPSAILSGRIWTRPLQPASHLRRCWIFSGNADMPSNTALASSTPPSSRPVERGFSGWIVWARITLRKLSCSDCAGSAVEPLLCRRNNVNPNAIPFAAVRATIHPSNAAVSGRYTYTICICCHRERNARKRFRLRRGPKFAVQSSTGSNSCCCRSIALIRSRSWICCLMLCQMRCRF